MTSKAAKANRALIAEIAARATTDPHYICDDGERLWAVLVKLKDGRVLKTSYYARTKPTLNQMADRLAQCGPEAWSEVKPPNDKLSDGSGL